MATYISGITDYIPQIQPFTPDYNFYSGALDLAQSKHDAARKSLSTIYGSLLNAPMTRDDNTETRDKFFKAISQDIHKMSGMDLSLSQNSDAAAGVFNQLLDNKSIVKDMVWTKTFQNELSKAEGYKNCIDPDKCGGGWWEGGERLLTYQRDGFRRATADDALTTANAKFTPYQDVTKLALDLAKEADLNVTMDTDTGQWITTTKNGPLIVEPLQKLFLGSIGKNPKVMEYYQAQSELDRKDYMYTNESTYGSLENAEQAYLTEMAPFVEQLYSSYQTETEDKVTTTTAKEAKVTKAIENATPAKASRLEKIRDEFTGLKEAYSNTLNDAKEVTGTMAIAKANKRYTGYQMDRILATFNLGTDINSAAQVMAYKNYESTVKENPYSMEATKQANRMLLEEFQTLNEMKVAAFKNELDNGGDGSEDDAATKSLKKGIDASGTGEANLPTVVTDILGNTDAGTAESDSEEALTAGYKAYDKDASGLKTDISSNEKLILERVYTRTDKEAEAGDAQAQEDYVNIVKSMINVGGYGKEVLARINSASTTKGKYLAAKMYKVNPDLAPGTMIDKVYKSTIAGMLKPDEQGNEINRDYLAPLWTSTENQRRNILAKDLALGQMNEWYAGEVKTIAAAARSDSKFGAIWGDAFEAYVGADGTEADQATFVKNMQAKGYTAAEATSMYNTDDDVNNGFLDWSMATLGVVNPILSAAGVKRKEKGNEYSVHDMWKRAFSEYATPDGDQSWLGITGAGNYAGKGQNYSIVDPGRYKSIATMGTIGFLKDALADPTAIASMGAFAASLPEDDAAAKSILQALYTDMLTQKKGDDRPLLNVTYSDIAASDATKVGLNIKINENYRKKYKGTAKEAGIMANDALASTGITVYMDKDKATNLFTAGSQQTTLEKVMKWKGSLDFDGYPEYTKDFKLEVDKTSGQYKASGMVVTGLKTDGLPIWHYYEMYHPYDTKLNTLVSYYDDLLASVVVEPNKAIEKKWLLENKK